MFTKKHYKTIAEIINETTDESVSIGVIYPKIDKRKFVFELADYFEQDNPQFDRERFIKACDISSN